MSVCSCEIMNTGISGDLIPTVITAVTSLLGVFVGYLLTRRASKAQIRRDEMRDAYSNVMSTFTHWVAQDDGSALANLVAAIYGARLVASKDTDNALEELLASVLDDQYDMNKCRNCLFEFWDQAKAELNHGKRKRRSTQK